jgi:hypothetical protein
MAADDTVTAHDREDAHRKLARMIGGFHITQLVHVAARLRLADMLSDAPLSAVELAGQLGAHAPFLYRVLRALVEIGLLSEEEDGRFGLTTMGRLLREDDPDSLRPVAIVYGDAFYQAWSGLLQGVKSGRTPFEELFGAAFFDYFAQHPELGEAFDRTMASLSTAMADEVVAAYDFSGIRTLVDVGGGHGALLAAVLKAHPAITGVLFDQPAVIDSAREWIAAEGLSDRCELIGGDFFEAVPEGKDAYLMKWILHDWDDERAVRILRNCRQAMGERARLLTVEVVLPDRVGTAPAGCRNDVHMLVLTGGRERTESEYRALLCAAGLQLTRVIPTRARSPIFGVALSIVEAAPAP